MWRVAILLSAIPALSCVATDTIRCGEQVCPSGTVCVESLQACYRPDQLDACQGLAEGATCRIDGTDAVCSSGVCSTGQCGDGLVTAPEECDSANIAGETCLSLGYYEGSELSCRADCTFDESLCAGRCGDAIVNGPEFCDGAPPVEFDCSNFAFDYGLLACSSICAPTTDACVSFGLAGIEPPINEDLLAISGTSTDDVYIITRTTLYRSAEDGWVTISLPSAPASGLKDVHSDSAATWVVGLGGYLVQVLDGVATVVDIPTADDLVEVHAAGNGEVWVGGLTTLHHFDGTIWTDRTADAGTAGPYGAFWSDSSDHLYIGSNSGLWFYDGADIVAIPEIARPVTAIGGSDPATVYVAEWNIAGGFPGVGELSRKVGQTWENLGQFGRAFYNPTSGEAPIAAIEVLSSSNVFALAGTPGSPTSSASLVHFDGNRLSAITQTISGVTRPYGMFAPSATDILISSGGLRHHAGFAFQDGPGSSNLVSGVFIAGAVAFPGGELFVSLFNPVSTGGVLQSDGSDWIAAEVVGRSRGISGRSATEVYLGHQGGVLRFDGSAWAPSLVTTSVVQAVAAGDRVLAGTDDGEIHEFDGSDWSVVASPGQALLRATPIPGGAVFATADEIIVLTASGTTTLDAGIRPLVLWASSESDIYVAEGGVVRRFDGEAWVDVDLGTSIFQTLALDGTGPDDVWLIGTFPAGRVVLHYDGVGWSRVVVPGTPSAVSATERFVAFFERITGDTTALLLKRPAP